MTGEGSWEPILTGPAADDARRAVGEIAAALAEHAEAPPAPDAIDHALFFAYLDSCVEDEAIESACEAALVRMAQRIEQGFAISGLYGGLTGAGWVAAHIIGGGDSEEDELDDDETDGDEFLIAVDRAILRDLSAETWQGDYDLIGGLCGLGVYLLERLEQNPEVAGRGLEHVVRHLGDLSEPGNPGCTWHTRPELLVPQQVARYPTGFYNIGLAHGVPGVIGLLARIAATRADSSRGRELLTGAVDWTLARRGAEGSHGRFPAVITEPDQAAGHGARAAWCYGDPGVVVSLFHAARATGNAAWEAEALAMAIECARRPESTCGVVDTGLCHGSAGLAHIFNRLYQATGESELRTAAERWFTKALAMRKPGKGVAGFSAFRVGTPDREASWEPNTSFLEGAAGIGLALLSAIEPLEPVWDRLLLCDVAPGPRASADEGRL